MKERVGSHDLLLVTLDTLRYDAAQRAYEQGLLGTLGPYLGPGGWQKRHSPGSFTYSAHQAFFAGFLPTPIGPGPHPRLFAAAFAGSATTVDSTFVFPEASLPRALEARGYRTHCIGGTGFFSQQNELSRVLPVLFSQAVWRPELGVTCPESPVHQVEEALRALEGEGRRLIFLNVAAIHQPNWFYGGEQGQDTLATHTGALVAVDRALKPLLQAMKERAPTFALVFSDHGTAYGEDGYQGHRLGHEVVWTVPYAEFEL